jgi:tripartite-type tricarboxylate transporter receptor subunit TctC
MIASWNRRKLVTALASASLLGAANVRAQGNPSQQLRLVVPYPAGGSTDALARQLSVRLTESMKRPVLVDNRPGGNSSVAVNYVLSQPADGSTLFIFDPSSLIINPHVYTKLPYDHTAFEPVAQLNRAWFMLLVNPQSPIKTLGEFIAAAKSRPTPFNYAASSAGTPAHLGMEMVKQTTKIPANFIPYKGSAPALNDLMGGQLDAQFIDVASAIQFVQAGKLRAIAVSSATRLSILPDVPTIAESGFPGFEVIAWFGSAVRKGTPAAEVQRLNTALVNAVTEPVMAEWIRSQAAVPPPPHTPQEFGQIMRADFQKWGQISKSLNISLD